MHHAIWYLIGPLDRQVENTLLNTEKSMLRVPSCRTALGCSMHGYASTLQAPKHGLQQLIPATRCQAAGLRTFCSLAFGLAWPALPDWLRQLAREASPSSFSGQSCQDGCEKFFSSKVVAPEYAPGLGKATGCTRTAGTIERPLPALSV
jgi:hypothetical protein